MALGPQLSLPAFGRFNNEGFWAVKPVPKAYSPGRQAERLNVQNLAAVQGNKQMGRPYELHLLPIHGVAHNLWNR